MPMKLKIISTFCLQLTGVPHRLGGRIPSSVRSIHRRSVDKVVRAPIAALTNRACGEKRSSVFALILALISSSLMANASQETQASAAPEKPTIATNVLTLDAAIALALTHNPTLRAVGGKVTAAAGRAEQARVWSNPELELSAEEWPVGGGRGFSDAKQTIGVAQTLPFPGKKSLDRRIGRAGVRVSELELELRRLELVRDVKAAFFRVLTADRLLNAVHELEQVAESSAATAQKRVAAGATPYQEQLRAEIQLEQARTTHADYQRTLAAAREILFTLMGRPDQQHLAVSGTLAETPNQSLLERDEAAWLPTHPSVAAANANVARAQLEVRRASLDPYPDVTVGVAGGRRGESDESIVELRFSLPLPLLDRSKGRQQEFRANMVVAEAELRAIRQQLQRDWANASQRYRTAVDQVAKYRERILPKATEALRLVQTGFQEGKFSFIDLLDTQRTTAEAQLVYQKKLLEMNLAQAELEALLHAQLTNR